MSAAYSVSIVTANKPHRFVQVLPVSFYSTEEINKDDKKSFLDCKMFFISVFQGNLGEGEWRWGGKCYHKNKSLWSAQCNVQYMEIIGKI